MDLGYGLWVWVGGFWFSVWFWVWGWVIASAVTLLALFVPSAFLLGLFFVLMISAARVQPNCSR